MQLSDAGDLVATSVLSTFLESCVRDILETDVQTVEEITRTFNSSVQNASIFSCSITEILCEVLTGSSPDQPMCSGSGSCISAQCFCDTGYHFNQFSLIAVNRKTNHI